MLIVEFPITGELRLPLLILEWVFTFTCFEMALVFLLRFFFKKEGEVRNYQELGYCGLLMGFFLMWVFYLFADYYVSTEIISPFFLWDRGSERAVFLNLGYFSLVFGAFSFILVMERKKKFLITKYFFSILFMILFIFFVAFFFVDILFTQDLTIIFWPLFILFLLIYTVDFARIIKKSEGHWIQRIAVFLSSFALLALGYLFTTDIILETFGLEIRLFGSFLQLGGILFLSYFFLKLPPFGEFDWADKIEDIFLMDNAGICLFHKSFSGTELVDENLISGAISSINMMLQELTKDEGISTIKKKGKSVIVCPSKLVKGVIFSKEDLDHIKSNLNIFVEKSETMFRSILQDFDGDITVFKPLEGVASDMFEK